MDATTTVGTARPFDVLDVHCPSHDVMRDLSGRWAPLVLLALGEGLTRFGQIHRRVGGSSERMISQTLRILREDGIVERVVDPDGRPAYALTPSGQEIAERVRDLVGALYSHLEREVRPTSRQDPPIQHQREAGHDQPHAGRR